MVTVKEIAAYLGVTPGYVRRVIAEHKIEGVKLKGRRAWVYPVAEIVRHTGTRDRLTNRR